MTNNLRIRHPRSMRIESQVEVGLPSLSKRSPRDMGTCQSSVQRGRDKTSSVEQNNCPHLRDREVNKESLKINYKSSLEKHGTTQGSSVLKTSNKSGGIFSLISHALFSKVPVVDGVEWGVDIVKTNPVMGRSILRQVLNMPSRSSNPSIVPKSQSTYETSPQNIILNDSKAISTSSESPVKSSTNSVTSSTCSINNYSKPNSPLMVEVESISPQVDHVQSQVDGSQKKRGRKLRHRNSAKKHQHVHFDPILNKENETDLVGNASFQPSVLSPPSTTQPTETPTVNELETCWVPLRSPSPHPKFLLKIPGGTPPATSFVYESKEKSSKEDKLEELHPTSHTSLETKRLSNEATDSCSKILPQCKEESLNNSMKRTITLQQSSDSLSTDISRITKETATQTSASFYTNGSSKSINHRNNCTDLQLYFGPKSPGNHWTTSNGSSTCDRRGNWLGSNAELVPKTSEQYSFHGFDICSQKISSTLNEVSSSHLGALQVTPHLFGCIKA